MGSVEMSSRFSVRNFSSNQKCLDNAAEALRDYLIIGTIWTAIVSTVMYCQHGLRGLLVGFVLNALIMTWLYISYTRAFAFCANKHCLEIPTVFTFEERD